MTNNYSKHFFRNGPEWSDDSNLMRKIQQTFSMIAIIGFVYLIILFPIIWLIPIYVCGLILFVNLFIECQTIIIVKEEGDDIRSEIWQMKYRDNKTLYMLNPYSNLSDKELGEAFQKIKNEKKFEEVMKDAVLIKETKENI